jgi:hypothetical protein
MSCKRLLALPLVAALMLTLTGSVRAQAEPPAGPGPGQPRTHTMTIYNGAKVERRTFVWQNGWQLTCPEGNPCDVYCRDGARAPWRCYGTYDSPRRAEEVACSLRAQGNLAAVRPHCP